MPKSVEPITVIRTEEVEFFISLFKEINVDIYKLLREARVPNDIQNAHYSYLPERTAKNLIGILGEHTTQEEFAINVWRACKERYIPRFLQQLSNDLTVKQALDEFCLLLPKFNTGAKVSVQHSGGKWWFIREKNYSEDVWFKYGELFSVIFINELMQAIAGEQWMPSEVGIQYPDCTEFELLPGLNKVQFFTERPVTAFLIPEHVLELKANTTSQPNQTHQTIQEPPKEFLPVFKLVIKPYLSMGKLPIKWASEILNLNVRTLQRKLDAEGVVYSQLIEEMVLEHTLELLSGTDIPITSIATKMGYSDSAHFTRAFKRQMKMTPRQFRKSSQ